MRVHEKRSLLCFAWVVLFVGVPFYMFLNCEPFAGMTSIEYQCHSSSTLFNTISLNVSKFWVESSYSLFIVFGYAFAIIGALGILLSKFDLLRDH